MALARISTAMRFFFLVTSLVLWTGIYLTGFNIVHWILYIPASFFVFAAITGICPGIIFSNKLFKRSTSNPQTRAI